MFTINEREYAWGDGELRMLGRFVAHFTGIEYKGKQDKEHLYAAGRNPRAIQRGRKGYEGTLTLLQSEVIALNAAARAQGYDDALGLSFDLTMSYIPENGGATTTDMMYSVEFTEIPHATKEGDMKMEIALPFLALGIKYDV